MDAVDAFKARAYGALGEINDLAQDLAAKQAKGDALDAIAARFEEMNADGAIDPQELDELIAKFEAQGLDTSRLRETEGAELSQLIKDRLDLAKSAAGATTMDRFRLQLALQDLGDNVRAASEVSATEHRTYMNVIRNLIA
jgi:hypothetical protein